ncbi:MAG: hypothetical protein ACYC8T_13975 [Myxococcaceae bacterium]
MRFLVHPQREARVRSRPPVMWFLCFAAITLLAAGVMRAGNGGLTPAGVAAYYLGDGEPLGAVALWEEVHTNAFLYGFVLLMLGSLLVASPVAPRLKALLVWGGFAMALFDLFLPFLVVASEGLGLLRVLSFGALNALLAAAIVTVALRYGRA